ncbi:glutathione S-transferase, partial [Escherichia coli]|nr:glutathione S-transferase [Escherichia coli]
MTQPIAFYFWPTPNCWKVSIALHEMGLPFELHPVNIGKGEQRAPDYLAISPSAKVPAIVDPDGPDGAPVPIFESGAILQYLARKTGQFYGTSERDRLTVDQWLMWQMGGLGPIGGQAHHFLKYGPEMDP